MPMAFAVAGLAELPAVVFSEVSGLPRLGVARLAEPGGSGTTIVVESLPSPLEGEHTIACTAALFNRRPGGRGFACGPVPFP